MPGLVRTLHKRAHDFGFFQVVSLLEEYHRWRGDSRDPVGDGTIAFRAHPSTAFPSSEVASCSTAGGRSELHLAFMGLLGSSSPLPEYFSEHAARYEWDGGPLRAFLDMFSSRIYALYYTAWRRHSRTEALGPALLALQRPGAVAPRNAEGLAELVSGLCDGAPVRVEEFVPCPVEVHDRQAVGSRAKLGDNATVGRSVLNRSGGFRLLVGPVTPQRYAELAREGTGRDAVRRAVFGYLDRPLTCAMVVYCRARRFARAQTAAAQSRLGQSCVLGSAGEGTVHRVCFLLRAGRH